MTFSVQFIRGFLALGLAVGVVLGLSGAIQVPAQPAGSDVWTFGPAADSQTVYSDGTRVPSREWKVFLNGAPVGQIEIHLHKRKGQDGKVDVSFGATFITYGPPPGGQ